MAGPQRPLSQQFPPADPELRAVPLARDELIRKSTRHEPPPEKSVPQYPSLTNQRQQFAPEERQLPKQRIPRDELNRKSNRHPTLPQKDIPRKQAATERNKMDTPKGSVKNGDLPHDQLIPLEELPKEPRPLSQHFNQQPPPVVVDDQPLLRRPRRRQPDSKNAAYNSTASHWLGIILIIIGACEILMNIIGIVLQDYQYRDGNWNVVFYLAPGLWCGVFFILCGTFGIVSAERKETWTIVTHLVASTLAAVFAFILVAILAWGLYREYDLSLPKDGNVHLPSVILLALMSFGAVLAIPLTITASVLCCRLFCQKPAEKNEGDNIHFRTY